MRVGAEDPAPELPDATLLPARAGAPARGSPPLSFQPRALGGSLPTSREHGFSSARRAAPRPGGVPTQPASQACASAQTPSFRPRGAVWRGWRGCGPPSSQHPRTVRPGRGAPARAWVQGRGMTFADPEQASYVSFLGRFVE